MPTSKSNSAELSKTQQIELMKQKVRSAELASEDHRLTPETRDRNRKAAQMGRLALKVLAQR